MGKITSREIAIAAALSALSATVQLIHVGYQSPQWGMWIDVVAVSWIIAYFLFGVRLSLIVTCVGTLMITLFAPDTWLGASMKFVATVPIIISFFVWQYVRRKSISHYSTGKKTVFPLIIGIIIRCCIVIPLNYYFAIPIWTGMTPSVAMKAIPWIIIAGFNIIQSLVDVILAWMIVYKFKISRFALGNIQ
jgi:riboflavin transporter